MTIQPIWDHRFWGLVTRDYDHGDQSECAFVLVCHPGASTSESILVGTVIPQTSTRRFAIHGHVDDEALKLEPAANLARTAVRTSFHDPR